MNHQLKNRMPTAAFAFRGYNITNLGKTPELLAVPAYQPILDKYLSEASSLYNELNDAKVDLAQRIRDRAPSDLSTFGMDAAVIVSVSLAQMEILETVFSVPIRKAKATFGYSLGELPALIVGGVYTMDQILRIPLAMWKDAADLANEVTMGVLFTRGRALDMNIVKRLCVRICTERNGLIAPSAVLAPNACLLLGEAETLERFKKEMVGSFPEKVVLRKNQHRWPPLHTPLLWKRGLMERAALLTHEVGGGFQIPSPPVISCVTGKASYTDFNSREILIKWIDHPQLLWDVIHETLASGFETVIHVGPEPNLIPSTYERISLDVSSQIGKNIVGKLGRRFMSGLAQRQWLTYLLTKDAALLRAPFIEHIVLEDWLLANAPK